MSYRKGDGSPNDPTAILIGRRVITEMTGAGHVYVRPISYWEAWFADCTPRPCSMFPGTREAVGCASWAIDQK